MKNSINLFFGLFIITLITQNFKCGRSPYRLCDEYKRDTVFAPFNISLSDTQTIRVFDTLFFTCQLNDTMKSKNGLRFIKTIDYANLAIQGYKVVNQGGSYRLNYANIEFNPLVLQGQFSTGYHPGINITFERSRPYNSAKMGIVPGQPGLYLFTLNSFATYYEGDFIIEGNECTSFHVVNKLNQTDNQSFNWDRLNTNSLELNGYPGHEIINRNNPNHFFIEVLP